MNSKQRTVIFAGVLVLCLMGLFPPWQQELFAKGGIHVLQPGGYAPIWAPKQASDFAESPWSFHVDIVRLAVQGITVCILTLGPTVALREDSLDKPSRKTKDSL